MSKKIFKIYVIKRKSLILSVLDARLTILKLLIIQAHTLVVDGRSMLMTMFCAHLLFILVIKHLLVYLVQFIKAFKLTMNVSAILDNKSVLV
jgi:hypothetical protein